MWQRCILKIGTVVVVICAGCSVNPDTGRKQFLLIDPQREIHIGDQAAPAFLRDNGGEIPSPQVRDYVSRVGRRLASQSRRPDLPWEFHTLDSSVLNAFALPGGKVFITRAMLERLESEAQLAGVLGHEIGHVTGKHVADRMSQALLLQAAAIGLGAVGRDKDEDWLRILGVSSQVGTTVYLLSFSRDQELEADKLGVRYMTLAGYNPVGQLQVMQILQESGPSARGVELFSTHPYPKTRIERLDRFIRRRYSDVENPAAYRFGFDDYRTQVLEPLGELPEPKHGRSGVSSQEAGI